MASPPRSPDPRWAAIMGGSKPNYVGRLVISVDDMAFKHAVINQDRLTIGRRPYNDIALDDLTVSGEHAVIQTKDRTSVIHDLRSRNGTLVNGSPIVHHELRDGDVIDVGIYRLKYSTRSVSGEGTIQHSSALTAGGDTEIRRRDELGSPPTQPVASMDNDLESLPIATVHTLNGLFAGRTLRLDRPICSVGNSGTQVAVISRRKEGYFITHLEGLAYPLVNGESIGLGAYILTHGDMIELAGTMLKFELPR